MKKPIKKSIDGASQKSDNRDAGGGKKTKLVIYQDKPRVVPLLIFLDGLKRSDRMAVVAVIEELERLGHGMRPPHSEHLGNQLYYLRVRGEDGSYRVFYFPHGKGICVLGHGFMKKTDKCPPEELKRARRMRERFEADPESHTYEENSNGGEEDY